MVSSLGSFTNEQVRTSSRRARVEVLVPSATPPSSACRDRPRVVAGSVSGTNVSDHGARGKFMRLEGHRHARRSSPGSVHSRADRRRFGVVRRVLGRASYTGCRRRRCPPGSLTSRHPRSSPSATPSPSVSTSSRRCTAVVLGILGQTVGIGVAGRVVDRRCSRSAGRRDRPAGRCRSCPRGAAARRGVVGTRASVRILASSFVSTSSRRRRRCRGARPRPKKSRAIPIGDSRRSSRPPWRPASASASVSNGQVQGVTAPSVPRRLLAVDRPSSVSACACVTAPSSHGIAPPSDAVAVGVRVGGGAERGLGGVGQAVPSGDVVAPPVEKRINAGTPRRRRGPRPRGRRLRDDDFEDDDFEDFFDEVPDSTSSTNVPDSDFFDEVPDSVFGPIWSELSRKSSWSRARARARDDGRCR